MKRSCLLFGLVALHLISAQPLSVSVKVGESVVLPCHGTPQTGSPPQDSLHLQWQTPRERVFEWKQGTVYQAPQFLGRVGLEVAKEVVGAQWDGNCSLRIQPVEFSDTELYESFFVDTRRRRMFLQSVWLTVTSHRSYINLKSGQDLHLDLHTHHRVRVLFQGSAGGPGELLWHNGPQGRYGDRLEKRARELTVKLLTSADQGSYTVLDSRNCTLSTVTVTVEESTRERTLSPGDPLTLPEEHRHLLVLFWPEGDTSSPRPVYTPPRGGEGRTEEGDRVVIQRLTPGHQGLYEVQDAQGNTVYKLRLSVAGMEKQSHSDGSRLRATFSLILSSLLLSAFLCPSLLPAW
ncbi:uncharacterized protein LOC136771824 [Amia ocellicauda]|uniref:uncharacterized protein LOC136771824 n=1 Tax=Amia ocellicauda TaxID=2972642 RepID=UPI003463BAC9